MKKKTSLAHIRNSMKRNTDRIRYGCIFEYGTQMYGATKNKRGDRITKYAIVDHPMCEFEEFDEYILAVERLNDLNLLAYRNKIDVTEHEVGTGREFKSENTYAIIKDVLNDMVLKVAKDNLKEDRIKRVENAKNRSKDTNVDKEIDKEVSEEVNEVLSDIFTNL